MKYRFTGSRRTDGHPIQGEMDVQDEATLRATLAERGVVLESVEPVADATDSAEPATPIPAVRVVDVDMPLGSMVRFIFMWSLATVPTAAFWLVLGYLVLDAVSNILAVFR